MLNIIGFVLSLVLVGNSGFKLWSDRDELKAKRRLLREAMVLIVGLAGVIISLSNGIIGDHEIANLNQSLSATQSYIVAAEEGRAPRSLTAVQQQIILRDLKAIGPPQAIAFYWDASSVEAKRYALQVMYPFQQAQWTVPVGGNKFGVPNYPIYIGYGSGGETVAKGLEKAFNDAGLSAQIQYQRTVPANTVVEIDIGDKP